MPAPGSRSAYRFFAPADAVETRLTDLVAAAFVAGLRAVVFRPAAGFVFAGALFVFNVTAAFTAGFAVTAAPFDFAEVDLLPAGFALAAAGFALSVADFTVADFTVVVDLAFVVVDFAVAGLALTAGLRAGAFVVGMLTTSWFDWSVQRAFDTSRTGPAAVTTRDNRVKLELGVFRDWHPRHRTGVTTDNGREERRSHAVRSSASSSTFVRRYAHLSGDLVSLPREGDVTQRRRRPDGPNRCGSVEGTVFA